MCLLCLSVFLFVIFFPYARQTPRFCYLPCACAHSTICPIPLMAAAAKPISVSLALAGDRYCCCYSLCRLPAFSFILILSSYLSLLVFALRNYCRVPPNVLQLICYYFLRIFIKHIVLVELCLYYITIQLLIFIRNFNG